MELALFLCRKDSSQSPRHTAKTAKTAASCKVCQSGQGLRGWGRRHPVSQTKCQAVREQSVLVKREKRLRHVSLCCLPVTRCRSGRGWTPRVTWRNPLARLLSLSRVQTSTWGTVIDSNDKKAFTPTLCHFHSEATS